ncbi:N-6 DNA methylase [Bacillus toyonensis]|uniref:N-6 DNA methylase n=1 Tax=Bacillus toyonensis TaxID=155322 RepID=UPI00103C4631|nr:N-6 DNA methylase [Bacillus toyonensis]MCU5303200.1 N-6 DNA methylase [Bacillus toyonensis]TBX46483.1 hypothetical protein E0M44_16320 [Bacillus toyonensis]
MKENYLLKNIYVYFTELGYPEISIDTQVLIKSIRYDMVIYKDKVPFITVEIKYTGSPLSDEDVEFNPYIEELQYKALVLETPYYVLTNGISFTWFKTGETGRPQLLEDPVYNNQTLEKNFDSKEELVAIFRNLNEVYQVNDNEGLPLDIILAWLYGIVRKNNISVLLEESFRDSEIDNFNMHVNPEYAFKMLDKIKMEQVRPKDFLSALDGVFSISKNKRDLGIPRWLADFTLKLCNLGIKNIQLLSMFNNNGAILAASVLNQSNQNGVVSYTGYNMSNESAVWEEVQMLVFSINSFFHNKINATGRIIRNIDEIPSDKKYTHIILTPPFLDNQKNNHILKCKNSEYELLEYAINALAPNGRIVAVIPNKILTETIHRQTRKLILTKTKITAVISLPNHAIRSKFDLNMSIMILDKKENVERSNDFIFMAEIKEPILRDTFNSLKIPKIKEVLDEFYNWNNIQSRKKLRNWFIPYQDLSEKNFSVKKYRVTDRDEMFIINTLLYPTVLLEDVTLRINRGTNVRLNNDGEILFIGPSAIRPMECRFEKLSRTSADKIPSRTVKTMQGDVVINRVGTYVGAAAVVNSDVLERMINQNVVLVRPNPEKVTPDYLAAVLNSKYVKTQITQHISDIGISSLSMEVIKSLKIPLPEIEEQKIIIDKINETKMEYLHALEMVKLAELKYANSINNLFNEEGEK